MCKMLIVKIVQQTSENLAADSDSFDNHVTSPCSELLLSNPEIFLVTSEASRDNLNLFEFASNHRKTF